MYEELMEEIVNILWAIAMQNSGKIKIPNHFLLLFSTKKGGIKIYRDNKTENLIIEAYEK